MRSTFIFVVLILALTGFARSDMLTTKRGKSILRCRWGKPRGASSLVRVSLKSRAIVNALSEKFRRVFLDWAILSGSRSKYYSLLKEGGR